jgi:hypothetical protein
MMRQAPEPVILEASGGGQSAGEGDPRYGLDQKLSNTLFGLSKVVNKKNCYKLLNRVFDYAIKNGFDPASSNVTYLLSITAVTSYHIVLPGEHPISQFGTDVSANLGPHNGRITYAFVEPASQDVWLDQSAFGQLSSILIHESFHLKWYANGFHGFGLSEIQLATALGKFKKGMSNEQASEESTKVLGDKCH